MNSGVIVHCPRCGAALMVLPAVGDACFVGNRVRFTFAVTDVEHECEATS